MGSGCGGGGDGWGWGGDNKNLQMSIPVLFCLALYLSQSSKGGNSGDVTIGRLVSRDVADANGDLCVQFYCNVNIAGSRSVVDVMVWRICRLIFIPFDFIGLL